MHLRIDRFTWIVIGVVLLLVVAAVVTVNLTGGKTESPANYRTDDSPDTPVYNAIVAVQAGERPPRASFIRVRARRPT